MNRQLPLQIVSRYAPSLASACALLALTTSVALPGVAEASPTTSVFTPTAGSPPGVRGFPAAAPLADGEVLIAGGLGESGAVGTAELYNPLTGAFANLSSSMTEARAYAVAVPLPNGEVLIAGGMGKSGLLNTAELFNPATGSFTAVSSTMKNQRFEAAAAPLPNGEVLIVGGSSGNAPLNTAELYNPATESFSAVSSTMITARVEAAAALLPNGEVLIVGGSSGGGPMNTAEIFNPATGTFTPASAMLAKRSYAAAVTLPNGEVLIAGGFNGTVFLNNAELFNPATGTFSELSAKMTATRKGAAAALLPDGEVLLAGGLGTGSKTAELFLSAPEAAFSGGAFGKEPVGETSADQAVTITNRGAQILAISGTSLGGADPQAFTVAANSCTGARLAFNQSCAITLSFTPKEVGPQTALVKLEDNEEKPAEIPLSGEGFPLAPGPQGPTGPQGPQGPTGKEGPPGKVEVLACKATKRAVKRHGRRRRVTVDRCTLKPLPKSFKLDGRKIVRISRSGRTYALGRARAGRILLHAARPLRPGRYTLQVGFGKRGRSLSVVVEASGTAH